MPKKNVFHGREPVPTPSVILVKPQLGQNIGMVARAMLNCTLTDLRIVLPRDGWPNKDAEAASADAHTVIQNARIYQSTSDALTDLGLVFATTARKRDMSKRVVFPQEAVEEISRFTVEGGTTGILFGRESQGLHNDDISLADAVLSIPANPRFNSLNLAQAVYAISYKWFEHNLFPAMERPKPSTENLPANKQNLIQMFEHLEAELDKKGFLRVAEKRPSMVRNLRNMLGKASLTEQEIRTFRGVIRALTSPTNLKKP